MEEINYIKYKQKNGNLIEVPIYNKYIVNLMSKFSINNYKPISIEEIIWQRVNNIEDNNLSKRWWLNYFNSGDSIMYHPDGRIKIVSNSQTLLNIYNKKDIDEKGSLILEKGTFDKTDGYEFSKSEVKKYANKPLKLKEILNNPIYLSFLKEDKNLFKEYILQVYSKIEEKDKELMKIWISEEKFEYESERLLCVLGINDKCSISGNQSGRLDCKKIRMVGILNNL